MVFAPKVVLELPLSDVQALQPFIEACLRDGVSLIAIVGQGASHIDDLIDEIVVADGSDPCRYISTTIHSNESVEHVLQFAALWKTESEGAVQRVRL